MVSGAKPKASLRRTACSSSGGRRASRCCNGRAWTLPEGGCGRHSGVSLLFLGECIFTVPDRAPRRRRPAGRASRTVSLGEDGLSTPATRHIDCRL